MGKFAILKLWFCFWYAVASQSAVLPHHLYSGLPMPQAAGTWGDAAALAAAQFNQEQLQQRLLAENAETYGYVDRFPPAERANHQMVFGIPRRFSDNMPSPYESLMAVASDYDNGYDNAANQYLLPPAYYPLKADSGLNKRTMRYSPYDLRDLYDDGSQIEDVPVGPSQEDVANFQKYIQRYFEPSKMEAETWNSYDELNSANYPGEWQEDEATNEEPVYNDEEAAIQLHSLLPSRKNNKQSAVRDIQKKSEANDVSSTTATATTASPLTTTATPQTVNRGQKEEALLRPPAPPRYHSPASLTAAPAAKDNNGSPQSLVDTIKRLFEMRDQVQDVEEGDSLRQENRMKRFVTQEDSLLSQLHSLSKVKA